jgi:uncharacterized membrane protein (DUF373 family)
MKGTRRSRKRLQSPPRRAEGEATQHVVAHRRRPAASSTDSDVTVVGAPVRFRREMAVTAVSPTSVSQRAWLGVVHRGFRRCDTVIFDGADHLIDGAERLVNRTVAIVLMGIAIFAVVDSIITLATTSAPASAAMTNALDNLLFAVILVEITATMRREEHHSKLKWYLVIGIISAVREILTAAARMSLQSVPANQLWSLALEMGVMMAVALGLALALRVAERDRDTSDAKSSAGKHKPVGVSHERRHASTAQTGGYPTPEAR